MQSSTPSECSPFNIDIRLIVSVQTSAGGARCHEAAGLISCYQLWGELHRRAVGTQDLPEARESRTVLERTEVELRKLLFECRRRR